MTMFSISPTLRTAVDRDGVVILDVRRGAVVTLNVTGGYIWRMVQAGKSVDEIVNGLALDTGEDPLSIAGDIHQFLDQLLANHLIALR